MTAPTARHLTPAQLWPLAKQLLTRFSAATDSETFLDDTLDTLVELLRADRGLVVLLGAGGDAHVINARGRGRALTELERVEISKSLVRKAHESGASVHWELGSRFEATESLSDLGILTALAVPIPGRPGRPARGVIYLDFREALEVVGATHLDFLEAAGVLISSSLDQQERLVETREALRESRLFGGGAAPPSLEALLSPPGMAPLRDDVMACVHGESPVLLLGESGTGKTVLAAAIAELSGRLPVARATLGASDDLNTITSELFGHERGSFSGAFNKRIGVVEHADGGTLILDEILNLPLPAQQLLLDFTQFGTYRPLGYSGREPKHATVRLIAATNGDLEQAVREGRFREDLYYRIAGATVHVPPLRERRLDVLGLIDGFLERFDPERRWTLSVGLRRQLVAPELRWPGNVRQLEAVVRRARERARLRDPETSMIEESDIKRRELGLDGAPVAASATRSEAPRSQPPTDIAANAGVEARWARLNADRERLEGLEAEILRDALAENDGVVARVARLLGVRRTSLISRLDTLGVRRSKP